MPTMYQRSFYALAAVRASTKPRILVCE